MGVDTRPAEHKETGPVRWSDEVDSVIRGDLTAAAAYVTPAKGAVISSVAPCGLDVRSAGMVGFTTSLGLPRKLERILKEPRVALAFHAREHGFSTSGRFVLVQGVATVDLTPSRERLLSLIPQAERFLGPVKLGPGWDWLLREYYYERVFVDISVTRISAWEHLDGSGAQEVFGADWALPPDPQKPPKGGTAPRVPVERLARQARRLTHRLVGYRGADGFPVVVPVRLLGHGPDGLHVAATPGLLPPGGRRAGFLAHSYRDQLVGLSTRTCTGWLSAGADGTAVYAPHTSKGFVAPPAKRVLLVSNGLVAKVGMWRARRSRLLEHLEELR